MLLFNRNGFMRCRSVRAQVLTAVLGILSCGCLLASLIFAALLELAGEEALQLRADPFLGRSLRRR